jgi:hypothetical protein
MVRIADKIIESLNSITNWIENWESTYLGLTFGKVSPSTLDTLITDAKNAGNWVDVARYKRIAELIGYTSTAIDDAVKAFLTNVPMFTSAPIPINESPSWFWSSLCVVLNGYRWAREYTHELSRWDYNKTIIALQKKRMDEPYPFYRTNIDTGEVTRTVPSGRWHESAEMTNSFILLSLLGSPPAISPEVKITCPLPGYAEWSALWDWNELNRIYWVGDHFNYSPDLPGWEMAAPTVHFIITKLHILNGRSLGEYYRVVQDTINRYIGWDAPQWGGYKVPVHHNPSNLQRTLDYYLPAIGLLHMVYKQMDSASQDVFRKMLTGEIAPRMADGLLASDLYSAPRFRMRNNLDLSDTATAEGAATLFLQAIIPEDGSLAIPVYHEGMEFREPTFFNAKHFGFNYDAKQIKIPVYAGKMRFYFGDSPTGEVSFPYDGVYTVTFTSDWSTVTKFERASDLPDPILYLSAPTPPPTLATSMAQLYVAVSTLVPFIVWKAKEIKEAVTKS